jgi:sarcosine oxidase gamma subunit
VVELRVVSPTVIAVLATTAAIDALRVPKGAVLCRVAPREALVIRNQGLGLADLKVKERGAIVEDVSDGWTAFELAGDDVAEAFARLSELELPEEGFVQGDVARIGAKVVAAPGRITILVPAMLGAFVDERIRTDCAELLT